MVCNEEYEISQQSKDILFQNVQYTIRNSIEYIYPSIVDGTKQWQCQLKGGRFLQPKSLQWIEDYFKKDHKETYEQLISDEFLDNAIRCPDVKEDDTNVVENTKSIIPSNMKATL